jgi:flagellar hook-associated protein 1 FlgK
MSSLSLALNNALSGLRVNQQSINVLSQNIANVNTVGYSRQVVEQSSVNIQGLGSGVQIDDITRKIDKYLQRSVQTQSSSNATSQTLNTYYENIQGLLGKPGAGNSIDSFMTSFFNSVQQLAEKPETNSLKSNAIAAGSALARQLSDLAANIHDLRYEADRGIADAVSSVNASLDRLKGINGALIQATSLGQSKAGLLDQRDKELSILAGLMNLSTTFADNGTVSIVAGNGAILLEDGIRHQLSYNKASSVNIFTGDGTLSPLQLLSFNDSGQQIGKPVDMITGGTSDQIKNTITGGSVAALQVIRDVKFPAILDQLDQLASRLRDNVNAIHNNGSGFPPATSLTGDRQVSATDQFSWLGTVRIAVLQSDGKPVSSLYADESYTGIRALKLDLGALNSGQGNGTPTLQTIIDEINNHFGSPGNKAQIGNLNNIQLASDTNQLPSGAPPLFNFDLDLDNISSNGSKVFVTGITVLDDTATNITSVTQTAPSLTISPSTSYATTIGLPDVTINLTTPATNLVVGDRIYLAAPTGAVNGIPAASLTGFFIVTAVTGNSVTFTAGANATSSGAVNDPGNIQMMQPYDTVVAGDKHRTRDQGQMQVDFSGNIASTYYDITVDVSVVDTKTGILTTAPVTYRVTNNINNQLNKRFDAQAIGAPGILVLPGTSQESLRATLVDANGNEIPTVNGQYTGTPSYLKIIGGNSGQTYSVAIDEMDSQQLGKPNSAPAEAGTNWGFSHYFGLNNFFTANNPTTTGETLKGSAFKLSVQDRLLENANLISTGALTQQSKSAATGNRDVYTYARYSGDNSIAQSLAKFNSQLLAFDAAGGLPTAQQSLQSYTSEILGFVSQRSSEASDNAANAQILFDGFKSKSDAVSGVNLDEELANTVTFQNAYSATARVITIVNKMYEELLQSF